MKHPQVLNQRTKQVLGILLGFGVSASGTQFAIVRPKSRALDQLIEVIEFNSKYEVKHER